MKSSDLNNDWRVQAVDALRDLVGEVSVEAENELNPARDVMEVIRSTLAEHFDISLADEIVRLVEFEHYGRELLRRLEHGVGTVCEDQCIGCGARTGPCEPGCIIEYMENI